MIDSEFDDFTRGRLGNHEVPVPAGLWDKLSDRQFDQFVGDTLKDKEAPVSGDLWDKITDSQFDGFIGNTLSGATATVPTGLWDKITDGQFDGFVSGKLSGYEAPVPPGLWEKIMPDQDDDTGAFAWLRSPGRTVAYLALLIALLGGGYYWFTASQKNVEHTTATGTETTPAGSTSQQKTNTQTTPATGFSGSQSPDPQGGENNSASTPVTVNPVQKDAANNTSAEKDNVQPDNTGNFTINAGNRKRNASGAIIPGSEKTVSSGQQTPPAITSLQNNNTTGSNTNTTEQNDFVFIEPYRAKHIAAATVPYIVKEVGMINKTLSPNHANRHKSIIICPSDKDRNTDWFVESYVSPDFAFRSLSANTASAQYMARKDSSESMRPGFTAGIRLVKPITDNFSLKAGLQYTQMNQRYVYRTENEVKTITVVSQRTIIRAPGDTVIIMDTSVVQQVGFKNNTVMNRFRSFDIPLMVGYQFGTREDDIRVGVNAGVIFNISSWYQGVMLDSTLATVAIPGKGTGNMIYKSKLGIGLYGGISITKKLGEVMDVFAEPYFRYNLSNMTTPNAPYNQKFSLGGISLGVRLNLNRR